MQQTMQKEPWQQSDDATNSDSPTHIIEAQHVITCDENDTVYSPGAVAFAGAKLLAVGTPESVRQQLNLATDSAEVIRLHSHVIMPGLINSHAHSAMALFRGMADDLPLMTWLQSHIWPAEARWISQDFVAAGTRLAMAEMLLSGTTAFTDMYFFPEIVAQTATAAGMRAQLACPLLDFPTAWGSGPDEYIEKTCALLEQYPHPGLADLVQIGFGPHAPYTVSDAPLEKVAELAKAHETFIQMHVHETEHEVKESVKNTGQRPLNRLHQLGLLSPQFQAVHFTQASAEDIALAAQTQLNVIHCPASNLKLACGFTPAQQFLNAKVNIALGTDGAASNNDLDLFDELKMASLLAKAVAKDASALPANTALALATRDAAAALGRTDIGTLKPGAAADFISANLDAPNTQPLYHAISQAAYALNSYQVQNVWIAGKQVVQDRTLKTLDQAEVLAEADHWHRKIQTHAEQ
jgi:5-methylthioadenosine/S-adenosylhomocysteine deaminase